MYSLAEAVTELANRNSLSELVDLVRNTSAKVEGAAANVTSLLYSGTVYGESLITVGKEISSSSAGAEGAGRFVRVDDSSVGKLLARGDFNSKLNIAINVELTTTVPGYEGLPVSEKNRLREEAFKLITEGKDINGNRLPVNPANPSLFDIVSRNFVEQATGDFRILAGSVAEGSVLLQTEIGALLERPGGFKVDGIDINYLRGIAPESAKNIVLSQAMTQTFLSDARPGNTDSFKVFSPDDVAVAYKDTAKIDAFQGMRNLLSDEQRLRFDAGSKAMHEAGVALAKSGLAKGLNKLGLVGGLLGFLSAAEASSKAEALGQTERATEIMKEWAVDAAGSGIGGIVGAAVGGIGVAVLAAAGAVLSAPVSGALILGATLLGAFFGGTGATDLYHLMEDRDRNLNRDFVDRLSNLFFGATSTITTPLPVDLNGAQFTIDAHLTRDEMVAKAKTDIAWRYALRELNGFVVTDVDYARHNSDGSLDLLDPHTGVGTMTDRYLADRSAMLAWKIQYETKGARDDNDDVHRTGAKPYNEDWDTNSLQGNWDFVDLTTRIPGGQPLTLAIDGTGISLSDHQVVFGTKTADEIEGAGQSDALYGMGGNDKLYGKGGDDYLEGGAGSDWLEGGTGNDTLVGGKDFDVYKFSSGWGTDIIEDSDGNGVIDVTGIGTVTGFGTKKVAENIWQTDDKKISYVLVPKEGHGHDLYITFSDRTDLIIVRDWSSSKSLGISLADTDPEPPSGTPELIGDILKQTNGGLYVTNASGYASAGVEPDAADILAGTVNGEIIRGLGGNDGITAGDGDDYIEGGEGSDLVLAGFGADTVFGGAGNDVIYGSAAGGINRPSSVNFTPPVTTDEEVARGFSWVATRKALPRWTGNVAQLLSVGVVGATIAPSGETTGNTIDGGAGNDFIAAGDGADIVHGGDDDDDIVGMGGADMLFGDAGSDFIWGDGYSNDIAAGIYTPNDAHGDDVLSGGAGNDVLVGQGGADELMGGTGDDWLWGDDADETTGGTPWSIHGDDYLDGGDGADRLTGGGRNDVLFGGGGNDLMWGDSASANEPAMYQGTDYLDGGDGNDQLHGGGNNDTILGGAGDDLLWGDDGQTVTSLAVQGNDYLDGGEGNDQLIGGGSDDMLLGGAGNDVMFGDDEVGNVAQFAHGNDILDGQEGDDTLMGGGGNDYLIGGDGDDRIWGDEGNDTLIGGAGTDALMGGAGDDTYIIASGDGVANAAGQSEVIDDVEGNNTVVLKGAQSNSLVVRYDASGNLVIDSSPTDRLVVLHGASASGNTYQIADGTSYSYNALIGKYAQGVVNSTDSEGHEHALGGKTNDRIASTTAYATLSGGKGSDVLTASGGNTTFRYELGDGTDYFNETSAKTNAQGQAVFSRVVFGAGITLSDLRLATAGDLKIQVGSNLDDTLSLGSFDQYKFEFADGSVVSYADLLARGFDGSSGRDTIRGAEGADRIDGHGGHDQLSGGTGDDSIFGGTGVDTLFGEDGNDRLDGGDGNDILSGGLGADTLDGGGGDDTLIGGLGVDVYRFGAGAGHDTILNTPNDLSGAQADVIEFATGISGSQLEVWREQDDLRITLKGAGDQLRIAGFFIEDGATANAVGSFAFADGTQWDLAAIKAAALVGTHGNDSLQGYATDDSLAGGFGNDYLAGNQGADTLEGNSGKDSIEGGTGADRIFGGADDDTLYGGEDADLLQGDSGNDSVYGDSGNDTLDGGAGDDWLYGGGGSDMYVFGRGSGRDTISNDDGDAQGTFTDAIRLAPGITTADLVLTRRGTSLDLYIGISGTPDVLRVVGYFAENGTTSATVERIVFSDGLEWDFAAVQSQVTTVAEGLTRWGEWNTPNTLIGGDGDDSLYGGDKNDTLDGGLGNDRLVGGVGSDVFRFGRNSGRDAISGFGGATDVDVVVLGAGIATGDVSLDREGNDLRLTILGTDDILRIVDYFVSQDPLSGAVIDQIRFADGTIWTNATIESFVPAWRAPTSDDDLLYLSRLTSGAGFVQGLDGNDAIYGGGGDDTLEGGDGRDSLYGGSGADILDGGLHSDYLAGDGGNDLLLGGAAADTLVGGDGNDTLDGGTGDDSMTGGYGSDIFVFGRGSGRDIINNYDGGDAAPDRILINAGVLPGDLRLSVDGQDLVIEIVGTSDSVRLVEQFSSTQPYRAVWQIEFADGTSWDRTAIEALLGRGSAESDELYGSSGNDLILALGGDDTVRAGLGADTVYGGEGADLLSGSSGDDVLLGEDQADELFGEDGNDSLLGGRGTDSLSGGNGHDVLDGGEGNDTLTGGLGNDVYLFGIGDGVDVIEPAAGNDERDVLRLKPGILPSDVTLSNAVYGFGGNLLVSINGTQDAIYVRDFFVVDGWGNAGSNVKEIQFDNGAIWDRAMINAMINGPVVTGTNGTDSLAAPGSVGTRLSGLEGNDSLTGGAGNDWLDGGAGVDTMSGGAGNDTYLIDNVQDVVNEALDGGLDTLQSSVSVQLGSNLENLWLVGQQSIQGKGNELNNRLQGNSGSNRLDGGLGADTMSGRAGDDIYVVDNAGDSVVEMAGEGFDTVESTITWTLAAEVEQLVLKGTEAINGTGNGLANVLVGNAASNRLDGGAGSDELRGGDGDDVYVVDQQGDIVFEESNGGIDTVEAWSYYELGENIENLVLKGGYVSGKGNAGDNTVIGSEYGNRLDGGAGADTLIGGLGDDTYVVDTVLDSIVEFAGEGRDTVESSLSWTLAAELENLTLVGEAALNATGNDSANELRGNAGANVLDGGIGNDTMYGGAGDDKYIVDSTGDVVTESASEGIDLVESSVSFTLGNNVENLSLTGSAAISGTGNTLANVLIGNSANNSLSGGGGNDTLDGGVGDDSMAGGTGNDTYYADSSSDVITESSNAGTDIVISSATFTLGANVENLMLTGSAAINGTGNTLANIIQGNAAGNILNGGGGNDTMSGGLGDDTYVVDATGDVVIESGSEGIDLVQSGVTYTLGANVENLTLTGTGAINGTGNTAANLLTGNSGANRLDGGAGADLMTGGAGNDVYVVDDVGDIIVEVSGGGTDSVESSVSYTLSAELEKLTLTGSSNTSATGNGLANTLIGNAGANRLDGGAGADSMTGGGGNDTYVVDNASDQTIEVASGGTDTVEASLNWTLASEVENLMLTGAAAINGTGNALANVLTGNSGNNVLNGGAGSDTLIGGAGNDTYVVDAAGDVITELANEGADLVQSSVTYTLSANVENLTLTGTSAINATGNAADNVLTGNSANNALTGGGGNDTLDGLGGADTLAGGTGDDTYYVDNASDVVTELAGEGNDTVWSTLTHTLAANVENLRLNATGAINGTGNTLDNILYAGAGNNTLNGLGGTDTASYLYASSAVTVSLAVTSAQATGGSGSDTLQNIENLTGSGFNDTLTGSTGANVLDGGAGNDTLTGGAGNDTYRMGRGQGSDTIVENDTTAGNADVALFGSDIATDQLWFRQAGNNLEVSVIGTSDKFTLNNWYLGNQYHVEQFRTSDGHLLSDSNVQNLVQAMASFSPPAAGQTTLPPNYQSSLGSVIAANWQ